jgi:hypothetical protein
VSGALAIHPRNSGGRQTVGPVAGFDGAAVASSVHDGVAGLDSRTHGGGPTARKGESQDRKGSDPNRLPALPLALRVPISSGRMKASVSRARSSVKG